MYNPLEKEFHVKMFLALAMVAALNAVIFFVYFVDEDVKKILSMDSFGINIDEELDKKVAEMVEGYPMENMHAYIAMQDEDVAAFLVSIAKKESNWGKRSPKLNGKDCYNYWGFRAKREKMGTGGHTCFDSPRQAVSTVARRIRELIDQDVDTPEKMIVWKCGSSCASHSDYSVNKWIGDVDLYYKKFYN